MYRKFIAETGNNKSFEMLPKYYWVLDKDEIPSSIRSNQPLWKELSAGYEEESFIILVEDLHSLAELLKQHRVPLSEMRKFVDVLNAASAKERTAKEATGAVRQGFFDKYFGRAAALFIAISSFAFAIGCSSSDASFTETNQSYNTVFEFGGATYDFIDNQTFDVYFAANVVSGVTFSMDRVYEDNNDALPADLSVNIGTPLHGVSISLLDEIGAEQEDPSSDHMITIELADNYSGDYAIPTVPSGDLLNNFEHDANIIDHTINSSGDQLTFTTINDTNATAYMGVPFETTQSFSYNDSFSVYIGNLTATQLQSLRFNLRDTSGKTFTFAPSTEKPLVANSVNVISFKYFNDLVKVLKDASIAKVDTQSARVILTNDAGSGAAIYSETPYSLNSAGKIKYTIRVTDTSSGYLERVLKNLTVTLEDDTASLPRTRNLSAGISLYDFVTSAVGPNTLSVEVEIPVAGGGYWEGNLLSDWGATAKMGIIKIAADATTDTFEVDDYSYAADGVTYGAPMKLFDFNIEEVEVLEIIYTKGPQVVDGVISSPKVVRSTGGEEVLDMQKDFGSVKKVSVSTKYTTTQSSRLKWNKKISWRP